MTDLTPDELKALEQADLDSDDYEVSCLARRWFPRLIAMARRVRSLSLDLDNLRDLAKGLNEALAEKDRLLAECRDKILRFTHGCRCLECESANALLAKLPQPKESDGR
jgi:hypothetical protein